MSNKPRSPGRHFLQIPGPTPIPDRVLRAIDQPVVDHRGPVFQKLSKRVLEKVKAPFKTKNPVIIFPSSGTGGWEAALVNTLSPGDKVLMFETGQVRVAVEHDGEEPGPQAGVHRIRLAHRCRPGSAQGTPSRPTRTMRSRRSVSSINETASGTTSPLQEIRAVLDELKHPALYFVDAVSSLASIDLRHDEWGIDVTIAGSQKGLMLPAGLGFNAVSEKALEASKKSTFPKSYWSWADMLGAMPAASFLIRRRRTCFTASTLRSICLKRRGYDRVLRPAQAPCRSDPPRRGCVGSRSPLQGSEVLFACRDLGPVAAGP